MKNEDFQIIIVKSQMSNDKSQMARRNVAFDTLQTTSGTDSLTPQFLKTYESETGSNANGCYPSFPRS